MKALLLVLVVACGGASEPLACTSQIVDSPDGRRLLVSCNHDVVDVPAECTRSGPSSWLCNTYHAQQPFCDTFPGVCR
jgi:hypothetical protein